MQAWKGQQGLCIFCSLREVATRTLKSSSNSTFTTSSHLGRSRVRERITKGKWKKLILSPAGSPAGLSARKARDATQARLGVSRLCGSDSTSMQKVFRMEASWEQAAELELQALKNKLQGGDSSGRQNSPHADIDPELKYFDEFELKIKRYFQDGDRTRKGKKQDSLQTSLVQSFVQDGRSGLRKSLLFAYLDHMAESSMPTGVPTSIPKHLDLRYPTEWYPVARKLQREIHLHVGPTNSGKTYHALKRLEEAGNGTYAGPLRLLAQEVYGRFHSKGIPCDLMTGDDVRVAEGSPAKLSSRTVEMVDCGMAVDVAVIDEIQMVEHEQRGWAWTRALLGTAAPELHLCGETRVVPLIRELAAIMGDTLHIHHYDRLNPLKAMSRSLKGNLKSLRHGDCVVSFSVLAIHATKKQIELETGRRVAVIYGSLPPDIRAQQAALFNDQDNDYDFLVASDAIGMGLNLSIKRIVFETLSKFDGSQQVQLSVSQIKQIAGRAGRYRTASQEKKEEGEETKLIDSQSDRVSSFKGTVKQSNVGLVTCLAEQDLGIIQTALKTEPTPIKAAGIQPPLEFINSFAHTMPAGTPFDYLLHRAADKASMHPRYFLCSMQDQANVVSCIGPVRGLTVIQMYVLGAAPTDFRSDVGRKVMGAMARCVANHRPVTVADLSELPLSVLDQKPSGNRQYLRDLEQLHKSLILFLWLSYRFTNIFMDRDMAAHAKELAEEKINTTLLEFSANPVLRKRLLLKRQAKEVKNSSDQSPSPSRQSIPAEVLEGSSRGLSEDLAESLSGASALAIDWENRMSRDSLSTTDSALLNSQPAEATAP